MRIKPTILVLASTFPRWKNDTEPRFVYDLSLRLKDKFHIIILAPHCVKSKTKEELDGLEVVRYRYAPERFESLAYEGGITAKLKTNKFNWFLLPFFFLGQWIAIVRIIKKHPVKVIHAHWLIPQGILALMARLISKNKPKILCTSHGGDLYSLNDPISKVIKRYVIRNVDALTVVSTAMQQEIKKLVQQTSLPEVAPMGTNLKRLFTPDDTVQRNPNLLLFVGRLVEKKGLKYLLRALPEVIKKYPNIILNIVGTGPEQKSLKQQITRLNLDNYVRFLGRLSHEELVGQYRQAYISVFPFIEADNGDKEGLGLVMIEAMGCGCPVIASDIPAVRDVIFDGKTGGFVEAGNSKELQEKIIMWLGREDICQTISAKALQVVRRKFDWKSVSTQYETILQTLI